MNGLLLAIEIMIVMWNAYDALKKGVSVWSVAALIVLSISIGNRMHAIN